MFYEILKDTIIDVIKMAPFLLAAYLLVELISRNLSGHIVSRMKGSKVVAPGIGAMLGSIPQCGFSVIGANLYGNRLISIGTLMAVFLATSDEALLVLISNPSQASLILPLIVIKVTIGTIAGVLLNLVLGDKKSSSKEIKEKPEDKISLSKAGESGILCHVLKHTGKTLLLIFCVMLILNIAVENLGIDRISALLMGNTLFQPVIAAFIGLLPNCAVSIMFTEMYLTKVISFGSLLAGLCAGAGMGLIVLFKSGRSKGDNLMVLAILYLISAAVGIIFS
ncbi:MAG: putative manganese transporter [Anaerovoracaceae bacterium]